MYAVIFEVYPEPHKIDEYLDIAAQLREQLQDTDGFISIERFSSLVEEGKILSLSFWRDEQAIQNWRNVEAHRIAQQKGRAGIFRNYRLRVASVERDYGMQQRHQAPEDSRNRHDQA